ncbi:MAG TPA: sugar ABC transporter ATP-binding protein [Clostridiaceae bacterium]|nr:sugar ABC transporter ATP-binding protein [Clostridiaceae bacterium]
MTEPILTMDNIDKRFPGVHALNDVHFDLYPGEVHALVGENGAGKSTLMKILAGIYTKDGGTITYDGRPIELSNTREAQDIGISIIHQELNMMNHLTVAQNMFIGKESRRGIFLDDRADNEKAAAVLAQLGMQSIDPRETVANLTVGRQQMVEIGKALTYNSKILILDEPTAALSDQEIDYLFGIIRELQDDGVAMIYISHRMDEIWRISDRITVLRDGEYIGTVKTKEVKQDKVIQMMVGRTIFVETKSESAIPADAETVLEVRGLNAGRMVQDVSFDLKRGEILCIAGLMGAGRTETVRALFGADKKESGEIIVEGSPVHIVTPADAVRAGISYLSEDRKRYGLAMGMNVAENSVMACYENYLNGPFIDQSKINAEAERYVEKLETRTPGVNQLVRNLSGGNQQKVVVAKWLIRNSNIFIFDEPTRGIDVGAKNEIYKLIHELAAEGKSIIVISSELPEVLRLADRIVVMAEGRITGILPAGSSQEMIMNLAHDISA